MRGGLLGSGRWRLQDRAAAAHTSADQVGYRGECRRARGAAALADRHASGGGGGRPASAPADHALGGRGPAAADRRGWPARPIPPAVRLGPGARRVRRRQRGYRGGRLGPVDAAQAGDRRPPQGGQPAPAGYPAARLPARRPGGRGRRRRAWPGLGTGCRRRALCGHRLRPRPADRPEATRASHPAGLRSTDRRGRGRQRAGELAETGPRFGRPSAGDAHRTARGCRLLPPSSRSDPARCGRRAQQPVVLDVCHDPAGLGGRARRPRPQPQRLWPAVRLAGHRGPGRERRRPPGACLAGRRAAAALGRPVSGGVLPGDRGAQRARRVYRPDLRRGRRDALEPDGCLLSSDDHLPRDLRQGGRCLPVGDLRRAANRLAAGGLGGRAGRHGLGLRHRGPAHHGGRPGPGHQAAVAGRAGDRRSGRAA